MSGRQHLCNAAIAFWCLGGILLPAQQHESQREIDEAALAFQQGKMAEAEQKLRPILEANPSDLRALVLMGAVLDTEQRYNDADVYYQRALKIAPGSVQLLNNAANHYLASGDRIRARELYLKTLALDPRHSNANLQLARLSVEDKRGRAALGYLSHLGDNDGGNPVVLELRARALSLSGQCSDATEVVKQLEGQPAGDWRIHFSAGAVYAGCKFYDQAEASFSRALDADPRNFDILYNLGLAALNAGHFDRAASVFETALNERPEEVDCLYQLSHAYVRQGRKVDAAALLARAGKLAPGRADILLLLAQVSAQLEFYQDAAATYDRYLRLKPGDDVARRERGFARANDGQFKNALPDLASYVQKHPRDAVGFYELATAEAYVDRSKALQSLNHALALDAGLVPARYTRAELNIEEGRPAASVDDFRILLDKEPSNYHFLVGLGQAYLALDRANEAAPVLKRALDVAPTASSALAVYLKVLEKLGRREEAAAIQSRLMQSRTPAAAPRHRAGLIEYLSLPPAEQRARYLANLRKSVAADPADFQWRIRLGRELFSDGKNAEALAVFREIKTVASDTDVLRRCGEALLEFEQYAPAREFLESAAATAPSVSEIRLDLATAVFHLEGAGTALEELDKIPEPERRGDYYLLRAQLLDSLGKIPEAADALNRGMLAAPTRASLYFQAASFLLKHQLRQEALALLEQANRIIPDSRELMLAQWVTMTLAHRDIDARKLLERIQTRWPEWDRPYLLNGILFELQLKPLEARQALETAIALGADTPEAYYYQALSITQSAPDDREAAERAISRALALTAKDPYIHLLAGKISLARKDYPAAIRHLLTATQLQPALVPARYALRTAYHAIGDEQKAAAELEEIKRIGEQTAGDQNPASMEDFLFTVRPPI
jgi:tetratricopeptide (TPR) repeat protein